MRQIMAVFMFLLIVVSPCAAFEPFVKKADNPLSFSAGRTPGEETFRFQPFVLRENGLYKMWYAVGHLPKYKIAYATSKDGLHWNIQDYLDLPEEYDAHDPSILKEGDRYILYFASREKTSTIRIFRIESDDGIHFDRSTLKEILSPTDVWDQNGASTPYVLKENNSYYLFYSGMGQWGWRVNLATSPDGRNWTKCPNNPIIYTADGSFVYSEGGTHYLFVHGPDKSGIRIYQTRAPLSCTSEWTPKETILTMGEPYDLEHISSPSVLKVRDALYLYYSGLDEHRNWTLNLAISAKEQEKPAIVIVPGMLASWNKEALLHNQETAYSDWRLLPFVREYDGLLKTLQNAGLREHEEYFLFPYDWRKNIDDSAHDLEEFIAQTVNRSHPDRQVTIVGHSLGGLVGAAWAHRTHKDRVGKVVTVGSPHQGVVQAYKPVEGGEIERDNTFTWLAEKIVLNLNKSTLETDRETLSKRVPVLRDLFPIFPFLTTESGETISISRMRVQNTRLQSYFDKRHDLIDILYTLSGNSLKTPNFLIVRNPGPVDSLVGNYPDGLPVNELGGVGDGTVLDLSASSDLGDSDFSLDHGELITNREGIRKMMELLEIPVEDTLITEGGKTVLSPSLIFMIQSPVLMQVTHNNFIYTEEDGLIFIPNAAAGSYNVTLTGLKKGNYTLTVGQIANENDIWEKVTGEITADPPGSQTDSYTVSFNSQSASENFTSLSQSPTPTVELVPTTFMSTPTPQYESLPTTHAPAVSAQESLGTVTETPYYKPPIVSQGTEGGLPVVLGQEVGDAQEPSENVRSTGLSALTIFIVVIGFFAFLLHVLRKRWRR